MTSNCYVPGCNSNSEEHPNLEFIQFPRSSLINDWFNAIDIGTGWIKNRKEFNYINSRVCGKHFLPSDFCWFHGRRTSVKGSAIPSVFNKVLEHEHRCRVCLEEGHIFITSTLPNQNMRIVDAIKEVFCIDLIPDKSLPQMICRKCFDSLTLALSLRQKIVHSELSYAANLMPQSSKENIIKVDAPDGIFIIKELPDNSCDKLLREMWESEGASKPFEVWLEDQRKMSIDNEKKSTKVSNENEPKERTKINSANKLLIQMWKDDGGTKSFKEWLEDQKFK